MSTFDGYITEFPEIQIDYFRKSPERPAPLACFLTHVHSDHLQGLESLRAPFIYCSPATRELLLRIEKYPHRINFQKSILESRRLHYKHLAKILRPIPLNTPTRIELTPKKHVKVTLLEANHCVGAVMFLVEGDGKAILYTGDIRAEQWWVKGLLRHPVLIPYTYGKKRLDKLYLDTTFAGASNPLREFPSKAEGLAELLRKIEDYPEDTIFYFRAWTFGYEDVWVALASALDAKVHVDRYQMGLYRSLMNSPGGREIPEVTALCGFALGNQSVDGCLSSNESSKIHSCEPGVCCSASRGSNTVYLVPIVNRTPDGEEIPEVALGGGAGDLYQVHELELQDKTVLEELEKLCTQHINDKQILSKTRDALLRAFQSKKQSLSLDQYGVQEDVSLESLVTKLSHGPSNTDKRLTNSTLPQTIRFPYSRHSSYSELCELVSAFRPRDIHPCTVDPSSWNEDVSIQRLFGHLCSGDVFAHDYHMRETLQADQSEGRTRKRARYDEDQSTQSTETSELAAESSISMNDTLEYERLATTPGLSPRTEARRDEIRRAHRYLHDHAEPGLLRIEPLPSSWTPGSEDEQQGAFNSAQAAHRIKSIQEQGSRFSGDRIFSPHLQRDDIAFSSSSRRTDTVPETGLVGDISIDTEKVGGDASTRKTRNKSRSRRTHEAGRERVMNRMRRNISAYLAANEDFQSADDDDACRSPCGQQTGEPDA